MKLHSILYGSLAAGAELANAKLDGVSSTSIGMGIQLGGGLAIPVSDAIAFDMSLAYRHSRYDRGGVNAYIGGIGVQVALDK